MRDGWRDKKSPFELHDLTAQASDKSDADKETAFNAAFNAFCDANGYTIAKSLVNCIRELALAAYNAKQESTS